jgi:hypothetical protein
MRPNFMMGASMKRGSEPASDRWQTGAGEIGALISFGYQDRSYRQYAASQNGPVPATTTVGGA